MVNQYGHKYRSQEELMALFSPEEKELLSHTLRKVNYTQVLIFYLCKLRFLSTYEISRLFGNEISPQTVLNYWKIAEQVYSSSRRLNKLIRIELERDKIDAAKEQKALYEEKRCNNLISGVFGGGSVQVPTKALQPSPITYSVPSPAITDAKPSPSTDPQIIQTIQTPEPEPQTEQQEETEPSPSTPIKKTTWVNI